MLEQADRERQQPIERAPRREHWDRRSDAGTALALTSPRSASGSTTAIPVETLLHFCWEPRFRVFTDTTHACYHRDERWNPSNTRAVIRHRQELVLTFCVDLTCVKRTGNVESDKNTHLSSPPSQTSTPHPPNQLQ